MMVSWLAAVVLFAQATVAHPVVGTFTVPGSPTFADAPAKRGVAVGEAEELGPVLTAQSAVAVDLASGAVLFGKRPQVVRPLASLTKLVTALAVIRAAPAWESEVVVVAADIPADGGTILRAGDRLTVRDVFSLLLVGSDNAAGRALARAVRGGDGSAFSNDLHRVIAEFRIETMQVREPTGLDPQNIGSAADVARVVAAAVRDPDIAVQMRAPEVIVNPHRPDGQLIRVRATNLLVRDRTMHAFAIRGGKTGYLDEAGSNLALVVERDGHRVAIVVLGSATRDDRFRDARVLADWVYRNYEW
jgi:D-alanyl-D-alanine endopeptidase (penicillin-binding protein 7)